MKPVHTLALSIAFAFAATSPVAADKVTTVPVKFAKGASSATMKGSFAGYDSVHYTLDARACQTMTVTLAGSSNANFNVFAPGDAPGDAPGAATALGSNADRGWTGKLPKTGTYTVQVYQMRASARRGEKVPYTITLSIR